MTKNKIWLSTPHMGGSEQYFIDEAFKSNWIAPLGSNIDAFEYDLEEYLGSNYVTALNSGTSAIHLGLILLGVETGDTVLCQSLTFSASANPIIYQGATPIFIDSELETWNLCPIALEEAIVSEIAKGKKPKVIIAVHLYGNPYKVQEIRAVADKYAIPILEDSAEALGSTYKGGKCGTFGDIGVFSFNGSKIITTSAGGALITCTKELKDKAIFLSTQARDNAPHYQHSQIGYNYRMSNICAGIGRGQMKVLEEHVVLRNKIHDFYIEVFQDITGVKVHSVPDSTYFSTYWLTSILIDPIATKGITSEMLRVALEAEEIESRPLWKPMHLQPVFTSFPFYGSNIAENLFNNGLCLPSSSNLTTEELQRIKVTINAVFGR